MRDGSTPEDHVLWPWTTPARAGATIAVVALIYSLATMSGHGITYDESALYHAGDRTLYWLQHLGEPDALRFDRPAPSGFHSDFERFPDPNDPLHYPVFPGLVAALTNWLFNTRLGILDGIDGHHLGALLLHVGALWLFCIYASRLLGRGPGIAGTIALALFPSAVGHSFNNPKDWPCAQFYGLFLLAFGIGVIEARFRDLLIAGVFLGLAFSAKMNAAFALATMVAWTPIAYGVLYFRRSALPVGVVAGYLLIPYIAGALFFALWPWLYQGRVNEWWQHLNEYVSFMVNYGAGSRPTWTAYSLRCLLFMSPPLVLVTAATYLAIGWRGDRRARASYTLLVLWLAVPIVRIAMPRSNFYDGNRHFIEYVPALCAMSGAGGAWIGARLLAWLTTLRFVHEARGTTHEARYEAPRTTHEARYEARGTTHDARFEARGTTHDARFEARGTRHEARFEARGTRHEARYEARGTRHQARRLPEYVLGAISVAVIALLTWPILQYRPFETAYFNSLIGGLGGSQRRALFAMAPPADRRVNGTEGDYWLSSMRQGLAIAAGFVAPGEAIGMCPGGDLIPALPHANWPQRRKPLVIPVNDDVRVVYVAPRESLCGFARIRELEAQRPILHRVEREGGLVYEILGARDGTTHPVLTPESLYTKPEWYKRYTR